MSKKAASTTLAEISKRWQSLGVTGQAHWKEISKQEFEARQAAAISKKVMTRFRKPPASMKTEPELSASSQDGCQSSTQVALLGQRYQLTSAVPMLGQGSYGQVTTVIDIKTGRKYAVKIGEQESLQREVHILKALDHPAFLKVIHHAFSSTLSFFLMPDAGESVSKDVGKFKGDTLKALSLQLFDGLTMLHGRRILHADLKPSNLLFCWRMGFSWFEELTLIILIIQVFYNICYFDSFPYRTKQNTNHPVTVS